MRFIIVSILVLLAFFESFSKELSNENGSFKINYEAADTVYPLDSRKVLISVKAAERYNDMVVKINGREIKPKSVGIYEYVEKVFTASLVEDQEHSITLDVTANDLKQNHVSITHKDVFVVKKYEINYSTDINSENGIGLLAQTGTTLRCSISPKRRDFNLQLKFSDDKKVLISPEKSLNSKDGYLYFKIQGHKGTGGLCLVDNDSAVLVGTYREMVILDDAAPKVKLKVGNNITTATAMTPAELSALTMDCKFVVSDNNVVVNYEVYKQGKLLISSKEMGGPIGSNLDFIRKNAKNFTKGDKLILWGEVIQFKLPNKEETTEEAPEDGYVRNTIYNLEAPFRYEITIK